MTRYLAVLDISDDDAIGVHFPDLPGCVAMGASEEEAIENATEALAEWAADVIAEGGELPHPRSNAELREAGALPQDSLALVYLPLLRDTGKLARANISLDAGLLADIDEAAARRGVTRSAFLAAAAREKIKAGA